ncbi:Pyrethroid hydrolase Ces2e [Frankliniella fusca]|uniref:Pyrethroid hydrolase Ces2e n=1 Tax=Frankliniella fusca TaxID=407009 RepID=A0AAE1HM70_9NEOP|nr:Pyrethroid hydrolase Ces2e [Frankliniella fusca]
MSPEPPTHPTDSDPSPTGMDTEPTHGGDPRNADADARGNAETAASSESKSTGDDRVQETPTASTSSLWSCLGSEVPAGLGTRMLWVTLVLAAALFFGASQTQDGEWTRVAEDGLPAVLAQPAQPRRGPRPRRRRSPLLTVRQLLQGLLPPAPAPPAPPARARSAAASSVRRGSRADCRLCVAECTGPVVATRQGQLCGRLATTATGVTYHSFQGIPFAKPPVGELRFQDPQPAEPWTGVRRALQPGAMCLQSGQGAVLETLSPTLKQAMILFRALPGFVSAAVRQQSEDCLFLNVYSRALEPGPGLGPGGSFPLPVLVWLHGGGFHMGSGGPDLYGPEYLMEASNAVVLVTLNYRLGPLGFLSVPDGGVPGNAGLKDQAAALRWVRDNIKAFGGDPHRVTIFGESAGGTSVQMHMVSPMSRGLFHAAISQSGSALNPRSSTTDGPDRARRLARMLGVQGGDDADLVRGLRQLPASVINARSESVLTDAERARGLAVHPFVPSAEPDQPGAFLPATPQELVYRGRAAPVPYITGVNSLEAGFMLNRQRDLSGADLHREMENLVPSDLGLQPGSPANAELARAMKRAYFGDSDRPTQMQMAEFYSDMFVNWVAQRTVNLYSRQGRPELYVYRFTHDGGLTFSQRLFDKRLPGVFHGDEMAYLFTQTAVPAARESPEDELVRKRMVELWTNFAASGNPNGDGDSPLLTTKWLPANNQSQAYLEIGADLVMKRGYLSPHVGFWDSVYPVREGGTRA